jgi:membrane protease YdiL (CAAX protease family)
VIFPPFAIAFYAYYAAVDVHIQHSFHPSFAPDFGSFALAQVVVVGLPEEAMFRGYCQTRLTDAFPKTTKLFGAEVSLPALVLQAALFALVHFVVDLDPQRLAVFFPGLLFGWLRAWRRGIGASILLHALSNLYADVLIRSWLS